MAKKQADPWRNEIAQLRRLSILINLPFSLYEEQKCIAQFYRSPLDINPVGPWAQELTDAKETNYAVTTGNLYIGCIPLNRKKGTILVGPVPSSLITANELREIALYGKDPIGIKNINSLKSFLDQMNPFHIEQMVALIVMIHNFFNQDMLNENQISHFSLKQYAIHQKLVISEQKHIDAEEPFTDNYQFENQLLFYVTHGMIEKLQKVNPSNISLPSLGPDQIRHNKNAMIILNSLCQRSAIFGGVHPATAYQIGSVYLHDIEACTTTEQLQRIEMDSPIYITYAQEVAKVIHPAISHPQIDEIMKYVRQNYYQKLTVGMLADIAGLSKEYLSSKFISVVGMSLPDYINHQKILEACSMLQFSNMSLLDISSALSFSSQSYFQKVFKNIMHCTPLQYLHSSPYKRMSIKL